MNLVNGLYWHPKIVKAAELLNGQVGHNEVFILYVLALAYSHQHLTNGYLPQGAVEKLWKICADGIRKEKVPSKSGQTSAKVMADTLSNRRVRLWHSRDGGWQIHDYLKHNPSASAVKTKREKNRQKQAAWRSRQDV